MPARSNYSCIDHFCTKAPWSGLFLIRFVDTSEPPAVVVAVVLVDDVGLRFFDFCVSSATDGYNNDTGSVNESSNERPTTIKTVNVACDQFTCMHHSHPIHRMQSTKMEDRCYFVSHMNIVVIRFVVVIVWDVYLHYDINKKRTVDVIEINS
jgi:hypothetical protein